MAQGQDGWHLPSEIWMQLAVGLWLPGYGDHVLMMAKHPL